jgi:hypothetical protein
MLGKKNNILPCKQKEVMATDNSHALFIEAFLRFSRSNKTYLHLIEIADLNNYKLLNKRDKVKAALKKVNSKPFVFVIHKN